MLNCWKVRTEKLWVGFFLLQIPFLSKQQNHHNLLCRLPFVAVFDRNRHDFFSKTTCHLFSSCKTLQYHLLAIPPWRKTDISPLSPLVQKVAVDNTIWGCSYVWPYSINEKPSFRNSCIVMTFFNHLGIALNTITLMSTPPSAEELADTVHNIHALSVYRVASVENLNASG